MGSPEKFIFKSRFSCSADEVYNWHARKGALERLIPPWEKTTVVAREGGIEPGGSVEMRMYAGPIPFRWVAHHVENRPGEMFRDIMHKGPFTSWSHSHLFTNLDGGSCLEDIIEYAIPMHTFVPERIKEYVKDTLFRTFHHRRNTLEADLMLHRCCSRKPMKVLISGASGVLGRALIPLLTTGGHQVWTLVRRSPDRDKNELYWNPLTSEIDELPVVDAVVHLAGEYIGLGRWTEEKKKIVVESRTRGTLLLAEKLAAQAIPARVFLCASAIGFYGDTGGDVVLEDCCAGDDFISEVCRVWEGATTPARDAGIRTVLMRIGVVLTPGGGALQRLLSTAPVGLFRCFGDGDQYISWISIDDTVSAILYAMSCEEIAGSLNITAPFPVTNREFMGTLAGILKRPLLFPVPASVLKMVYGQMASEILLSGCRASCRKLLDAGFRFRHKTLVEALNGLLGRFERETGPMENCGK